MIFLHLVLSLVAYSNGFGLLEVETNKQLFSLNFFGEMSFKF